MMRRRAALLRVDIVPLDLERVPPLLGGPETVGDHGDAARHLHHLDDSRHGGGGHGIEGFDGGAEQRRPLEQRHQHAGQLHIERELRRPIALGRDIDPRRAACRSA